ncbi:MAG: hypothetical protein RLN88_12485 [Ekhidna sp.]|uniref:hypothetical protein n=1 Tax=Ekhidna sp. TaxID=2608089 RepID=UPI0032EBDC5E
MSNFKTLFLIDAIGAMLSAVLLGIVLVQFQPMIGLPVHILRILAGIAALFMIYSFSCFMVNPTNAAVKLRTIAIANLLYCVITLVLMILFFDELTLYGLAYFIIEIMVIVFLAKHEFKSTLD